MMSSARPRGRRGRDGAETADFGKLLAMLAFTIGWQEILIIVLFLLGVIVIPLPGRWMRRAKRRPLRWSEEFLAAPVPTIHDVAEAFFCSYPRGEYTLVAKERFRVAFWRGPEPSDDDGRVVLSLRGDPAPDEMPVLLRVLLQPRPDALLITMRHEVRVARELDKSTRKALAAAFRREVKDFRVYLRDNFGTPESFADSGERPVKRIEVKRSSTIKPKGR